MRRLLRCCLGLVAATLPAFSQAHAQCEPTWLYGPDQSYPGVNSYITAMTVYDDGSGTGAALYAAGDFTIAGDAQVNHIARWNNVEWSPLAAGLDGTVLSLAAGNGLLIAGGRFTCPTDPTIRNIAAWDGVAWHALGEGLPHEVVALAEYHGQIHASTLRPSAEGPPDGKVFRWDGAAWRQLPALAGSVEVFALTVFQNELYAGGLFDRAGGNTSRNLARWDGLTWKPLRGGEPRVEPPFWNGVSKMCVYKNRLIVAGAISKLGPVTVENIGAYDGQSWSALGAGPGTSEWISALAVYGDRLMISGLFDPLDEPNDLRAWDGTAWSQLPAGNSCIAMTEFQGRLFVGTSIATAHSGAAVGRGITAWDGQAWSGLTPGFDRTVEEMSVSGGRLYFLGDFSRAGSSLRPSGDIHLARWDGDTWDWIRLEHGGEIWSWTMTAHDDAIVAAGPVSFTDHEVLRIDGATPTRLGGLFNGRITDLFSSGADLIATGNFTAVDGVAASHVARWDGAAWQPMGDGFPEPASSFAVFQGQLIAAGDGWVRRWNGSAWTTINGGPRGPVNSMIVYGDRLVAAGFFSTVGLATPARSIATWNGTSWSRFGAGAQGLAGIDGRVWKLAVLDGDLVAAGEFASAGGVPAANIARWDGTSWQSMGGGTNDRVNALAVYNGELILGGPFTIVDDRVSAFWARWGCPPAVLDDPILNPVTEILAPMPKRTTRR